MKQFIGAQPTWPTRATGAINPHRDDSSRRLKFAFARSARIQRRTPPFVRKVLWADVPYPQFFSEVGYRIHPDDAHLEYGPLSSALRNSVLCPDKLTLYPTLIAAMVFVRASIPNYWIALDEDDGIVLNMLKLFLAEALADEGL